MISIPSAVYIDYLGNVKLLKDIRFFIFYLQSIHAVCVQGLTPAPAYLSTCQLRLLLYSRCMRSSLLSIQITKKITLALFTASSLISEAAAFYKVTLYKKVAIKKYQDLSHVSAVALKPLHCFTDLDAGNS